MCQVPCWVLQMQQWLEQSLLVNERQALKPTPLTLWVLELTTYIKDPPGTCPLSFLWVVQCRLCFHPSVLGPLWLLGSEGGLCRHSEMGSPLSQGHRFLYRLRTEVSKPLWESTRKSCCTWRLCTTTDLGTVKCGITWPWTWLTPSRYPSLGWQMLVGDLQAEFDCWQE